MVMFVNKMVEIEREWITLLIPDLKDGVVLLLSSIGVTSSVFRRKVCLGGIIKGRQITGNHDSYQIHFSLNSFNNINEGHKGERNNSKWTHNGKPLKIIQIEPIDTPEFVYDLTIDVDSHTFVANGILAHNTATPLRLDGKGLGRHADGCFDDMIVGTDMRTLINQGYLTDYRIFSPPTLNFNRDDIKTTASGELSKGQVNDAVNNSSLVAHKDGNAIVGDVVKSYKRFGNNQLGVVFVPSMDIGEELTLEFNNSGIPALLVNAKTPDNERANAIKRFSNGEIRVLLNVDIFGEGFDLPAISVVSMVRPSKSYGLYVQQFGRALRLLDGKKHGIIIDHVGMVTGRYGHGLPDAPRTWTLDAQDKVRSGSSTINPIKTCNNCMLSYERYLKACPECGYVDTPTERTIEQVDGSLTELSPDFLRQLRGEVSLIDRPVDDQVNEYIAGLNPHIKPLHAKRHIKDFRKKVEANIDSQRELRVEMAKWAGVKRAEGRNDDEIHKIWYITYGVDWLSTQSLTSVDADGLKGWLTTGKK